LTPDFGDAAIASWPCSASLATTLEPIRPLPPITTIVIALPSSRSRRRLDRRQDDSDDRTRTRNQAQVAGLDPGDMSAGAPIHLFLERRRDHVVEGPEERP
jgi:hypothetical protein